MEFQLGLNPSQSPSYHHCDDDHFLQRTWHTQARQNPGQTVSCPVEGVYIGTLPDAPGLCARLESDCEQKETMFYTVSYCQDKDSVYQGREAV